MEMLSAGAAGFLDLEHVRLEKTAAALLERVRKRGGAANFRSNLDAGLRMGQPFFEGYYPRERFLLC